VGSASLVTVYFHNPLCSCRACGLEWRATSLEPCPRCNEGSLHAEAVNLLEERDDARTIARHLLALVRKLRGDLDSTRGELRVLESMIAPNVARGEVPEAVARKHSDPEKRVQELERRLRAVDRATYGAFPEQEESTG
jgi:hypothetical protein